MHHKGKTSINICFLLLIFFLGTCFAKSTLNSIGPFQGLPQGLQFKGFNLGLLMIGSPLESSVIWSSLGSSVLRFSLESLVIGSSLGSSVIIRSSLGSWFFESSPKCHVNVTSYIRSLYVVCSLVCVC